MVARSREVADHRAATRAVENSMCAYWLSLGEQGERYDGSDLKWVYTGRPALNRVVGARLRPAEADARIIDVLTRFRTWGASVTWLTGPSTQPDDLQRRLQAHGFARQDDWIGMALDLSGFNERSGAPRGPPAGLVVREAVDEATAEVWLQTISAGFRLPPAARETFRALPVRGGAGAPWRRYVGFMNGRPVSTATLFCGGEVAGVYLVATVPRARGQGLGSALTRHALAAARAGGHELAVLQATPAVQDLYRKVGFSACCTIGVYRWAPAGGQDIRHRIAGGLRRLLLRP